MIRILHSVSNMDRAGIETMLMNYYRHMDHDKIQFDFLCNKKKPGAYDEEIKQLGGRIYRTPGLNPLKFLMYLKYMKELLGKYPEYKVIEAHNGSFGVYALYSAKRNRVPVRIYHAHGASITVDLKMPLKLFCKSRLKNNMTHHFTCGKAAAEFYFGKRIVDEDDYELIPNAIEVERFVYNPQIREDMREKYNLCDKHVIGHVGRFMTQKNHEFLIKLFAEYHKLDNKTVLVLLGDGELMASMKEKVVQLGLEDSILFVGNVSNVNEWYQAFDLFVLPSIWEGLPVVGVEAQAADLPCIFSDSITKEIGFSDKATFISLNAPIEEWTKAISEKIVLTERKNQEELITRNHYNIKKEAVVLQERYIELYGESNR